MNESRKYRSKKTFRQKTEAWEKQYLSKRAMLSVNSKGRNEKDELCSIRTIFQQDKDRILHCKSFRRLKHKTQVFIAPDGDHYRTRLTHTLEVSAIARAAAVALRLNTDLTEAIAFGHDLGHPPFGHAGEKYLDEIMRERGFEPGFLHNIQSLRIVEKIENDGKGLNLTEETKDGIKLHTKGMDDLTTGISEGQLPKTEEGRLVRIADRFAYLYADLEDAIRAEIINRDEIPVLFDDRLREKPSRILDHMVREFVEHSDKTG
ncbi:MAG: dGTP triphosphohydrolase, partial [bacterium]